MRPDRTRVLFLYTEAAPYLIACLRQLAIDHSVEVHLVRWPVNNEAPFTFTDDLIKITERDRNDDALASHVDRISPHIIFTSGWVDKGYVKICRRYRSQGFPVVLCSDTAWRGDLRQLLALPIARSYVRSAFSHAWVTGEAQAKYARKLGLRSDRIRKGFYSADTDRFLPIGEQNLQRDPAWPHRLLCVARYIPTKGHQYLCDAFAELCDENGAGDWELWIAGTGELFERVMNSRSGAHPRIRHLGFKQPHEMEIVLTQVGAFILPSTYEPWGVVVHEHTCAGSPLLLSDAVGAAEKFLRPGENGFSFKAGDRDHLKRTLRKLIRLSDVDLVAMGRKSHALAQQWDPRKWAATAMEFISDRP